MNQVNKISTVDFNEQQFDDLCGWIESNLDHPIGWQELFEQSGLDFQGTQRLFYLYADTTPMTWIRSRREVKMGGNVNRRTTLSLKKSG